MAIKTAIQNSIQDEIIIIAGKDMKIHKIMEKKFIRFQIKKLLTQLKFLLKVTQKKKQMKILQKGFQISTKKNCLLNLMEYQ